MALNKKDLETINTMLTTVVKAELTPLQKEVSELKKSINALSKDNAKPETKKATKTTKTSKSSTPKKSETAKSDVIQRMYIHALTRLEGDDFTKTWNLVKLHGGKIKHSGKKDKNGKDLACWTFSVEDGQCFATDIVRKKVFGDRDVKKILKSEVVEIEKK